MNCIGRLKMTLESGRLWAAMRWLNDKAHYCLTAIFALGGYALQHLLIDRSTRKSEYDQRPRSADHGVLLHVHSPL